MSRKGQFGNRRERMSQSSVFTGINTQVDRGGGGRARKATKKTAGAKIGKALTAKYGRNTKRRARAGGKRVTVRSHTRGGHKVKGYTRRGR